MISVDAAKAIFAAHVSQMAEISGLPLRCRDDLIISRDFGWVFFYDSANANDAIAGNAPVIIDRRDGTLHETGTAHDVAYYIKNYELHGSPWGADYV